MSMPSGWEPPDQDLPRLVDAQPVAWAELAAQVEPLIQNQFDHERQCDVAGAKRLTPALKCSCAERPAVIMRCSKCGLIIHIVILGPGRCDHVDAVNRLGQIPPDDWKPTI